MGHSILTTVGREIPPQEDGDATVEQHATTISTTSTAINWFRKGLAILEPYEGSQQSAKEWKRTKLGLMQGLAQACLAASSSDPSHLDTADSIVREMIDDKDLQAEDPSQAMRYTMIAILKMRKAPVLTVVTVLESLVSDVAITEENVNKLIGEVSNLTGTYDCAAGGIYVRFLEAMVQDVDGSIWVLVHRVFLAPLLYLQSRVLTEPDQSLRQAQKALKGNTLDAIGKFGGSQPCTSCTVINESTRGNLNFEQALACTTVRAAVGSESIR